MQPEAVCDWVCERMTPLPDISREHNHAGPSMYILSSRSQEQFVIFNLGS